MIPGVIRSAIDQELTQIEALQHCKVLLAVESGSRAWGFASGDSDYDVRFIYIHRSEWYLSVDLDRKRDVIERPITDELDISGWDIRKALRLFAKSNPPLLEWLGSPIVYREACGFGDEVRTLLADYYSPTSSIYHYLHMAEGNYRDYLRGDVVWLKKYLYALRPVLAVRWLEQGRGVVPIEFDRLFVTINDRPDLVSQIQELLKRKMAGDELTRGPAVPAISDFLADELSRFGAYKPTAPAMRRDFGPLNALFHRTLECAWSLA